MKSTALARSLQKTIEDDALAGRKMAFISGPRQVGKTTLARALLRHPENEFNWDSVKFRREWNRDPARSVQTRLSGPILIDEIHKDRKWKSRLKGLYDSIGRETPILVTGSGKLDVYRKGGDSMLGRYLPYRLHPFSVAESDSVNSPESVLENAPVKHRWNDLVALSGFPEPLIAASEAKAARWSRLRLDRLVHEDLRDFRGVMDLHAFRTLCELIPGKVGAPFSMNSMREDVGVAYATVRSWVEILDALYFTFRIRPYATKIARALKAEPKIYLFDILMIPGEEKAKRLENLAALHLLKACHCWTDTAHGHFELHYVRDKQKREVDFLIARNRKPWMLVECKSGRKEISKNLLLFKDALKPEHSVRLVSDESHDKFYPAFGVRVIGYEKFFARMV